MHRRRCTPAVGNAAGARPLSKQLEALGVNAEDPNHDRARRCDSRRLGVSDWRAGWASPPRRFRSSAFFPGTGLTVTDRPRAQSALFMAPQGASGPDSYWDERHDDPWRRPSRKETARPAQRAAAPTDLLRTLPDWCLAVVAPFRPFVGAASRRLPRSHRMSFPGPTSALPRLIAEPAAVPRGGRQRR